jgi:CBS domain containing-hemolysin-like protein
MARFGIVLFIVLLGSPLAFAASGDSSVQDFWAMIAYVFLALAFSFMCSVAEAVLLSITPSFIALTKSKQPKTAALLDDLKNKNIDRSLAAILTLNTIAHTVGAIGAGAKATIVFGDKWFGVFSAVMTLMILVLSEIIPKTLGALHWRTLAPVTAHFIRTLIFCLYPLILLTERITKLLSKGKSMHLFSRDDFIAMAEIGVASGEMLRKESRVIRNLFRLNSLCVKDVMTPRTVISALPQDMTVDQLVAKSATIPFSRLPIYSQNLDDADGFILQSDAFLAQAQGKGQQPISSLKRDIQSVFGEMSLWRLFDQLLDSRLHIALVVDEYGDIQGLVSLEDALETLLGMEIVDETDTTVDMRQLARQQWEKRAKSLGVRDDK